MPVFNYKAYDKSGREVAGNLDAIGLKDAIQSLKKDGLYPARIVEVDFVRRGREKVATHDLALTTRQLATLLSSGANLSDALTVLADEEGNTRLKSVILHIKDTIAEGSSLASAMNSYPQIFSGIYRGMVAAGEASGSLDRILPRLADYLETRAKIIRDIRFAVIYPVFMIAVGIGVLSILFIFVIPKITRIFEDTKNVLPWITIVLLWVTDLLRHYWSVIIFAIIGIIWGGRFYIKTPAGKTMKDKLSLKVPWFGGLIIKFYISNLTRTLGNLLKGGIPIIKALEMTKVVLNHMVFNEVINKAIQDIVSGSSLSASFKKAESIPPIVNHMIAVGETGGNLDEMLLKASDIYEQEFESEIKKTLTLLEPVLILIMGVIIGFIVIAILLPIFQLNQVIR